MICRMDNSGLGNLTWELARHLQPEKILLIENGVFQTFPERYAEFNTRTVGKARSISIEEQNWLTTDVDIIISAETFYSGDIPNIAKQRGVKTALITMFEMSPERFSYKPDMFICPSLLDFDTMPDPKVLLPTAIATDRLPWKERKTASVFVHNASHGGMNKRKGTPLLIEAMRHVKNKDIKVIINSWFPITCKDSRVEIRMRNYKNYWQMWQEGDVLIYPQDYNGICLPVMEAFASGMGVITTDIYPFNTYLPERLMFKHKGLYKTRASNGLMEVDAARIDPVDLAAKIDEIAGTDITEESHAGKRWANAHSWGALLPRYKKVLEEICARK